MTTMLVLPRIAISLLYRGTFWPKFVDAPAVVSVRITFGLFFRERLLAYAEEVPQAADIFLGKNPREIVASEPCP